MGSAPQCFTTLALSSFTSLGPVSSMILPASMETESYDCEREQATLTKGQTYIPQHLGVTEKNSDYAVSASEDNMTSCVESGDDCDKQTQSCPWRIHADHGGYVSFPDEDKSEAIPMGTIKDVINLSENNTPVKNDVIYNFDEAYIECLLEGLDRGLPDDYKVHISNKPAWLDMKKIKIGQQFAQDNYFGLSCTEMLSLLILFSFPDGLQPLIYTGKSGTPFTAFRRYLSTVLRVKSWFDHDVWNEESLGYRNLKIVRAMHLNISKQINSVPYNELEDQITVKGSSKAVESTLKDSIVEDVKASCPFQKVRIPTINKSSKQVYYSQTSMSITQFVFVGLMVTYPDKFGAASATDEELEGFVHMWRALGYLLGIEDKFNICNGTLQEVKKRCKYIIEKVLIAQFPNVTEDWEHMGRCMVEGANYYDVGLSFEVSLRYLFWVLGIPLPRTTAAMSLWHIFMFNFVKLTLCYTMSLPGIRPFINWLVQISLNKATSWPSETLKKLQN